MSYQTLQTELQENILKITLHRPESFNALNFQMMEDLQKVLLTEAKAPEVRAVLLTGSGKAFCSGGDIKNFQEALNSGAALPFFHRMVGCLQDMVLLVKQLAVPVIAAVNGPAVGAGFSLAAMADLLLASPKAYFALGYLKVGLSPDGGATFFLPRILGTHKTFELLALNEKLSVEEAKQSGLVAKIFSEKDFENESFKIAKILASLPPQAVKMGKRLIFQSLNTPIEVQLNQELLGIEVTSLTKDFVEGVNAFVEKREPRFQGN